MHLRQWCCRHNHRWYRHKKIVADVDAASTRKILHNRRGRGHKKIIAVLVAVSLAFYDSVASSSIVATVVLSGCCHRKFVRAGDVLTVRSVKVRSEGERVCRGGYSCRWNSRFKYSGCKYLFPRIFDVARHFRKSRVTPLHPTHACTESPSRFHS